MQRIAAAILVFAIAGQAFAADLPMPPPPRAKQQTPAQPRTEFDRLPGDCMEASNGCQRYVRAADGKFDAMNNIGIACQPQNLVCTKRK